MSAPASPVRRSLPGRLLRVFAPLFAAGVVFFPVAAAVLLATAGGPPEVVGRGAAGSMIALPQSTQVRVVAPPGTSLASVECAVQGSDRARFSGRLTTNEITVDGTPLAEVGSVTSAGSDTAASLTCDGLDGEILLLRGGNPPPALSVVAAALFMTLLSAVFAAIGYSLRRSDRRGDRP